MTRSQRVRQIWAEQAAAHNEGELANAHQMAAITGRDMTNWMPRGQEVTNPMVCSDEQCGWSGFNWQEVDGEALCPNCGSELW